MPSVKVKENEPVDIAIRRFKRACEKAGVLADVRKKEFFEKPTQERKRKKAAAVKRYKKKYIVSKCVINANTDLSVTQISKAPNLIWGFLF